MRCRLRPQRPLHVGCQSGAGDRGRPLDGLVGGRMFRAELSGARFGPGLGGRICGRLASQPGGRGALEQYRLDDDRSDRLRLSCGHFSAAPLPSRYLRNFWTRSCGRASSFRPASGKPCSRALSDRISRRGLSAISVPTLIVWGAHDAICPRSEQEVLAEVHSVCAARLYEDAGHAPHWEEPARFAGDLVDFVGYCVGSMHGWAADALTSVLRANANNESSTQVAAGRI